MNQIQEAEFNMLKYFHEFCQENNLKYFLYSGTLLGSVRHKGFIPWDDDADVAMRRKEFNKFESLFIKSDYKKDGYYYQSGRLDDRLATSFSKIRDPRINIRERTSRTQKGNQGPWLDIFPLDNIPDDEDLRREQFKKVSFYNRIIKLSLLVNVKENDKGIKRIAKKTLQAFNERFNKYYFFLPYVFKMRNKYINMYNHIETSHSADLSFMHFKDYQDYSTHIFDNSKIEELKLREFEGFKFYIPKNYDYVLSNMYGDYMTIPPKDEQETHQLEYIEED